MYIGSRVANCFQRYPNRWESPGFFKFITIFRDNIEKIDDMRDHTRDYMRGMQVIREGTYRTDAVLGSHESLTLGARVEKVSDWRPRLHQVAECCGGEVRCRAWHQRKRTGGWHQRARFRALCKSNSTHASIRSIEIVHTCLGRLRCYGFEEDGDLVLSGIITKGISQM